MLVFLFLVAAVLAGMWAYVKFFGQPKTPCGCVDK
jgi:hypothetical protein